MGICYYVISVEHKVVFDLDKGWGRQEAEKRDLAAVIDQLRLTRALPDRDVFDRAIRDTWRSWAELSKEAYDMCAAAPERHLYWRAERWVWDEEGDCYIIRNAWSGREDPTEAEALEKAREDRAYVQRVADRLWAFCEKYGPQLELISDGGDLPWWATSGWRCVGSRFEPGLQYGTEERPLPLGEEP